MSKQIGQAWVFDDNVDTDLIYHNKYLAETDPKQMPQYAFEYYPGRENFAKEVKPGDFVVAGKNFGCGSSREHAVYCLEYAGILCVLAETCSRIYYRNAINNLTMGAGYGGSPYQPGGQYARAGRFRAPYIDYRHGSVQVA